MAALAGTTPASIVRESLRAGATIDGPAIIAERNATTVVEPGWQATLDAAARCLVLSRVSAARRRSTRSARRSTR